MSKPDPATKQLQADLLLLGFDPGPLDGLHGKKTRAALEKYATARDMLYGDGERVCNEVTREANTKRAELPHVLQVEGNKDNLKGKSRDFSKPLYLQIHQTDFWAGDIVATVKRIKTNLYVSTRAVYEVHPIAAIIDHNYSDFVHIEVSWVSESRIVVKDKDGKPYPPREAGVWTPEREALLETAIVYEVEQARKQGVELTLITHCQTYSERTIDPDLEIAQATYRIAKKHGFKLDFDWVRGSGKSAAKWYPEGEGNL